MTLEQLRVFVAVAERQHVTQAGTLFLAEARAVLARVDQAERTLEDLGDLRRGTLSVQASQTIASYWLPRHLVAFRAAHPGIDIRLSVGNTAQVAAAVHSGAAELGFVEGRIEDPLLNARPVAQDHLVIVVGPAHPWAARGGIAAGKQRETPWVLREPGSGTRSAFEAALAPYGIAPGDLPCGLELPTNEAVRAAVEAGLGATALSASVAAPSLEAGLLVRVDFPLPARSFTVLRHAERHESRAAAALLFLVRPRGDP